MERVYHLLHGGLACTAHEGTALAVFLVLDNLKLTFEGGDFLDVRTVCELGGDVDHHHYHKYDHREPVTGEEIARDHLAEGHTFADACTLGCHWGSMVGFVGLVFLVGLVELVGLEKLSIFKL